jgi:hypothetical protein
MRTKFNVRRIQFPARQASENAVEPINFVFDDEEDALCDEYVVASREGDMPALQEYLNELRVD